MSEEPTTTSLPTRDESAESTTTPAKRRRRRRTAACAQCRNRKLKCDQEYPICGRCAKGPRPSDCTYQDAVHHQLPTSSNSSTSQPPVAGWGKSATVRVPDRNGVAAAGRERSSEDGARANRTQPQAVVSALGVVDDGSGQCNSAPKSNAEFIKRHLDYTPSSKRRKTFPDEAPGLGSSILEDDGLYSRDHRSQLLDIPTKTYWRGKDCWSRFYGSSLIVNMISEFPDLKSYAKEIKAENPVLTKFRHDLVAVKERNRCHKHSAEKTIQSTIDSTSLFNLLPTRDIVEGLVTDYLTYIEPTHRVFHITSFRRELDAVWEQEPANIEATVLVQLLLILASAWIFHRDAGNTSADEKSLTSDTAKNWIRQCESWLQNNRCKRPGPATFRIRCLFIIARDANATRKCETWTETGSLIKLAMSAGYHREPDCQLAKISGFNREMRRRLWVTMVELDLEASLYRGMPPTIQQEDFDSIMPSNYNDEDINQDGELPQPSPSNVVTDSSFQVALARSLPLRLKICALVNAPRIRVSYEDLHWLEGEVMRHLSYIPNWKSSPTPVNPQQQEQFILWTTLFETKLGQNLLTLLSSVTPEASIYFNQFARTRLEIATTILCQQQRLLSDINHSDGNDGSANNKLAILYPLTAAPLQAALVVCHHLNTMDSGYTSKTIHTYLPSIPLSLLSIVEKTLTSLEPKTVLLEKGLKEYYILSMIIALVKTKTAASDGTPSASAAATYSKEAVDRAAMLGYKVLAKKREKHCGDCPEGDGECHKKNKGNKYAQQEQHGQLPHQQPSQNINMTTTPISMEETPPSLDNLATGTGNGGVDLNNIEIPTLPQNFDFDFDFDWDFLLLDDADVNMNLGGVGGVPYPGQNLGADGFGNFY